MKPCAVGLAAILAAASPCAAAPAREQALRDLHATAVEARRRAVETLADAGTMADLPLVAGALRDTDDQVRALAEAAMWRIWGRSGDEAVDALLAAGVEQMKARRGEAAIETFSRVIARKPQFAEGWNKRATVYYLMGRYDESLADCREVLRRNPWHFGALSGAGMIYLRLAQPEQALAWFERALAINPNLEALRRRVQQLRDLLAQQRRDAT